jgi:acid phosphatase type 7
MNKDKKIKRYFFPVKKQPALLATMFVLIVLVSALMGGGPIPASAQTTSVILAGAGDISTCSNSNDSKTAQLLGQIVPSLVFTTGDNAYDSGSSTQYTNCYHPTWGKYKSITKPVPGNVEYKTSGASGYFNYFGVPKYYAYNAGAWRIYALNSEIDTSSTSAQVQWLKNDLAANPKKCVLAYWHRPRWSSGVHGSNSKVQSLWQALYNAQAELVINGHDHSYERFAMMNANGQAVSTGLREIVAGTGGSGHTGFGTILSASRVRNGSTYGVLKLTLRSDGYDWKFVPISGQTFSDSGSTACH